MNEASWLLDAWVRDFGQVLEMMTAQSCAVRWAPALTPPEASFWWSQTFSAALSSPLLVGASAGAWNEIGRVALAAAGIEEFERAEAKNTFIEMLQQSFSATATGLTAKLGRTVELANGEVTESPQTSGFAATISVAIGDTTCELHVVVSDGLTAVVAGPVPQQQSPAAAPPRPPAPFDGAHGSGVDFLLDVELPVSISFGNARLPLKDVLKLTTGSVVELDQQPEEPVDVIVNNTLIARGEVVVVEGNYGVRISHIVNRQSRLALKTQDRPSLTRPSA